MKKLALVLLGVLAVAIPVFAQVQQLDLNLSGRLDAITGGILITLSHSTSPTPASTQTASRAR